MHTLTGHNQTVVGLATQALEPQVITGSMDSTVRLWDLVAGRASAVLTNHKKAVRSICLSPKEYTFVSASADNMKKWNARRKLKGGIKAVMASNRVAAAARGGQ